MITAYPTQTIGNRLVRELVQQETEKRMAAFYAEQAAAMAAKDAEIADLRRRLRNAEKRSERTYKRMCGKYTVQRTSGIRRVLEALMGCIALVIHHG